MADDLRIWNSAQSSFSSDPSTSTTLNDNSAYQQSPPRQRPGYARLTSEQSIEETGQDRQFSRAQIPRTLRRTTHGGLGIATESTSPYATAGASRSPPTDSTGYGSPGIVLTPGSENPMTSPPPLPTPRFARETSYDPGAYDSGRNTPKHRYSQSMTEDYAGFLAGAETDQLKNYPTPSMRSVRTGKSKYDETFHPAHGCPSSQGFYSKATHWLTITIYTLAIFSTVFSGIYLGIALKAPMWGHKVHTGGNFSPSTANVLTNLFGKLIELSFVAVFVTFLGQVLSRRAISKAGRGITLAEMNMRHWIMQPGTLITHYETVQFAALTVLGAASLTVTVVAMFYTTAAQALVAPQLRFGKWEPRVLTANVQTTFANPKWMAKTCSTPITPDDWNPNLSAQLVGTTCLQIDHAAQGYHNYHRYMASWAESAAKGNTSTDQRLRPEGFGLLFENTTINASWINTIDTPTVSKKFNRIVNNVTLAFPHANVFNAARDPRSDIMQPEDLDGIGMYSIIAAVPSPYINVLCANMNKTELEPFVYGKQGVTLNATADLPIAFLKNVDWAKLYKSKTAVDDIFEWGVQSEKPVFYKYPLDFNTILNNTGMWPQASIYLLGKGDPLATSDYFMCRLRGGLTTNCSTRYTAMGKSGNMLAHCEDEADEYSYIRGNGNSSRITTISSDWFNVATESMNSMSLNNGVTDGMASNARLLTQLQLTDKQLSTTTPSPAEALAVMSGCSLLMAALDTPFVEYWNYTKIPLDQPSPQTFNALVQAQQYASGGTQSYQKVFYIVLFIVFLTNVLVLAYFIWQHGLVTDFSEPPNLFSIAVNSPPNELLAGSCGGGPTGTQYKVNWKVEHENDHLYMAGDMPSSDTRALASGKDSSYRGAFTSLRQRGGRDGQEDEFADEMELGITHQAANPAGSPLTPATTLGLTAQTTAGSSLGGDGGLPRPNKVGRMYSKLSKRKSIF